MNQLPFAFDLLPATFIPSQYDNHIKRGLSSMKGQFSEQQEYAISLEKEDTLLYEVFEIKVPEKAGELMHGITVLHPGAVGQEYFMTKGHFHEELETAEVYYCLDGEGCMVMETPEGEWAVEMLYPGRVLYVPPRWAHRSVNTGGRDLVMFFLYPANAGHDYGTIERQGFRKLVMKGEDGMQITDNPRWNPAEKVND
jgi:glucose-6-phosphate isomerase, archaeal